MKLDSTEENKKTEEDISKMKVSSNRPNYSDPLFMMYKRFPRKLKND